jgi:hypothetical protein
MWNYSKLLGYFGGHLEINRIGSDRNLSSIRVEAKVEARLQFKDAMQKIKCRINQAHFVEFDSLSLMHILNLNSCLVQ